MNEYKGINNNSLKKLIFLHRRLYREHSDNFREYIKKVKIEKVIEILREIDNKTTRRTAYSYIQTLRKLAGIL
ncbi:MAG: hypothetical protein ACTSPL_08370 [Candidatus Odinarchaeia archaeon]